VMIFPCPAPYPRLHGLTRVCPHLSHLDAKTITKEKE
jgi:hypothetical protein